MSENEEDSSDEEQGEKEERSRIRTAIEVTRALLEIIWLLARLLRM